MVGIYKITNLLNNKSYIGQSNNIERRINEHFTSNSQEIDQIIKEVGKNNFSIEVLEECTVEELNDKEKYWIKFYNSFYDGYNQTLGGQNEYYGRPILTVEDVKQIRQAYNNHESRQEVYKNYKDKITFEGFCHIWNGSRWKNIMPEVYTEENKQYYKEKGKFKTGQQHPFAKLTDEEVMSIRKRYIEETATQIWQDYKDKYTLNSFKQILTGVKYSHLPIYKKVEKRWINL